MKTLSLAPVLFAILTFVPGALAAPPNIVFFLVDDMGWQDTSVPFHTERTPLNARYHTPNMEALAKEGMKFTQGYACSLCSPTRVSLATGSNSARHRVTNWTLRANSSPDPENQFVNPPTWNVNGLCTEPDVARTYHAVTLPQLLKKAGYRTIHAGKAHFGAKGTPGEDPVNLGFDVNIAGHAAGGPGSYYGKYNFSAAFRKGDRIWDVPGLDKYHGQDINLTEALTLEANEAVKRAVADRVPFYLYMSHYAIHAPFEADTRFVEKYKASGLTGMAATWASMIESMDKSLGDIRAMLKELDVAENTIIIFMGDNGSPREAPQNLPLRAHKLSPYEGGIRVAMIVDWPGVTKPEAVCHQPVIVEDFFPTLLEMAAIPKAHWPRDQIDGKSILPLLSGDGDDSRKTRPFYWHFPHTYGQAPFSSIRRGDWKLIYFHIHQKSELYNIRNDLSETRNLAADHPELVRELSSLLAQHLRATEAQMPIDRRTNAPVPLPDQRWKN